MIKRWHYGLFVALAIGVLAAAIFALRKPTEPKFKGMKLSEWLAMADAGDPHSGYLPKEAVFAIGTNGIPTLLEMIGAVDPPQPVSKIVQRIGFQRPAVHLNSRALTGFRILGTNAVSAIPGLTDVCTRNRSPNSVRCAVEALGEMGGAAQPAVPTLVRQFAHTNADVRLSATTALMRIGGQPDFAVPALTRALNDPNAGVRWNAVVVLQIYETNARPAIPELLKLLNDPSLVGDRGRRWAIERTLSLAGFSKTNSSDQIHH